MSRIARLTSRLIQTPARSVHSKPTDVFGHKIAVSVDAPAKTTAQISNLIYANFFRRNAVFITLVVGAAAVGSGLYDDAMEAAWEFNNKGKLFKDVIKQYPNLPPNTEPETSDEPEAEEEEAVEEETTATESAEDQPDQRDLIKEEEPIKPQQTESNVEVEEQTKSSP